MTVLALVILNKIIIGLSGAVIAGLFALTAKYLMLNPAEEATDAVMTKVKTKEREE